MGDLARRLSVVAPARHVGVAHRLLADRDDLLGVLEVDAHPPRVASVQEPMLVLPLRLEVEPREREPEALVGKRQGVDPSTLRVDGEQAALEAT
jgi:hypothetical protein